VVNSVGISEQAKAKIIRLLAEGDCLNTNDLEGFYRWVHASYKSLGFDTVQGDRFAQYFGSSCDSISMRLCKGLWMLKQALDGDASDH
jgi:hypothetical protein